MRDTFEVSITFEPILEVGFGTTNGRIPAHDVVFDIPSVNAGIRVRNETHVIDGRDGKPDGVREDRALIVELKADDEEDAIAQAVSIASLLCRIEALVLDAGIALSYLRPSTRNLTRPELDQRVPRALGIQSIGHHQHADWVEVVWQRLSSLTDGDIRDAVELGLEWTYIAKGARDERSAFIAYWTALELMLQLVPPLTPPVKSVTVFSQYVAKNTRDAALDAVSESLARWIADPVARQRICQSVRQTKFERDVDRWARTLGERGVSYKGSAINPEVLREWQRVRHRLVHSGGTSRKVPIKDQVLPIRSAPVSGVKDVVREFIFRLLGASLTVVTPP